MYSPPCVWDGSSVVSSSSIQIRKKRRRYRRRWRDNLIWSYVCHHYKADQETDDTDGKQKKFTSMANMEEGRIDVRNGCYNSFQTYKLKHRPLSHNITSYLFHWFYHSRNFPSTHHKILGTLNTFCKCGSYVLRIQRPLHIPNSFSSN